MAKSKFRPKKAELKASGLDAPLKGQHSEEYSQAQTILDLLDDFEREAKIGRDDAFKRAVRNEKLYHNEESDPSDHWASTIPRTLNYFSNLVLTLASRLQEDRPFVKAYPTHHADVNVARLADAYLGHMYRQNKLDSLLMECTLYCILHGATYVRVTWDPNKGPPLREQQQDPLTGRPLVLADGTPLYNNLGPAGDVALDRFSIFDCAYSGVDPESSEWCVLTKYVSRDEAKQILRDSGYSSEMVSNVTLQETAPDQVFSRGVKLIKVQEVWVRPGGVLKDGLFAKVVGHNVAEYMDFPYDHGRIPVVGWKYSPKSNVRWSTSPADAAAPIQIYINDLQKKKLELVYRTADFTKVLATKRVFDRIGSSNSAIEVSNVQEVNAGARWILPPPLPPMIFQEQGQAISQMHEVFGLNEMLSGRENAKAGTSAKAIAYLQKQDSQKHAACMRRHEVFIGTLSKMGIDLFRQYAVAERQIQVLGEGSEMYVKDLVGADLDGADVVIEPASGIERFRAQQEAEIQAELQGQMITPQQAKNRMDTGLPEDMDTHRQLEAARKAVHDAAQGHGVQVPPGVPPNLILNEIAIAEQRYDGANNPGLQQLKQMVQQGAAQQQVGPGGPPPPSPPQV